MRLSSRTKNARTAPSRSRTAENVLGAAAHQPSSWATASGPSWRAAIAKIAALSSLRAGSTTSGWAPLGKKASRTTGFAIRYSMSAVYRHSSAAAASRTSLRSRRQAALR